jgi:hypothetical protein
LHPTLLLAHKNLLLTGRTDQKNCNSDTEKLRTSKSIFFCFYQRPITTDEKNLGVINFFIKKIDLLPVDWRGLSIKFFISTSQIGAFIVCHFLDLELPGFSKNMQATQRGRFMYLTKRAATL